MLMKIDGAKVKQGQRIVIKYWTSAVSRLRATIPPSVSHAWSRDPHELQILIDGTESLPHLKEDSAISVADIDALRHSVKKYGSLLSATVSVPINKCFVRDISIPATALTRIDEIVAVDLERTTPFKICEVHSGWQIVNKKEDTGKIQIRHFLLKRSVTARAVSMLKSAQTPLKAINVIGSDNEVLPVNLLSPGERTRAPVSTRIRNAIAVELFVIGALSVAAFGVALNSRETTLATLDENIKHATIQLQNLRKQNTEAEATTALLRQPRMRRVERQTALAVWDEITKRIPDSTWLTDLRIEDDTAQIDGNSTNASELISLLNNSKMLSGIAFASPITRDPQRGVERFQIKFRLENGRIAETAQHNLLKNRE